MIENIRKYTGLMIVVLVLLFVGLVFLDGGISKAFNGKPVMEVADHSISKKEFDRQRALMQLPNLLPDAFEIPRDSQLLASHYLGDTLIESQLPKTPSFLVRIMASYLQPSLAEPERFIANRINVRKAGVDFGVTPSNEEVEKFVENVLFVDPEGNPDTEAYSEFIKNRVSAIGGNRGFNDYIRDLLTAQNLSKILGGGISTEMNTERALFDVQKQEITGSKITLETGVYEGKVKPTEEELKTYFEENKGNYNSDELRKISYVLIEPDWDAALVKSKEAKAKEAEKQKKVEEAKKKAEEIKKKAEDAARKANEANEASEPAEDPTPAEEPAGSETETTPPAETPAAETTTPAETTEPETTTPATEGPQGDPGDPGEPAPAPVDTPSPVTEASSTEGDPAAGDIGSGLDEALEDATSETGTNPLTTPPTPVKPITPPAPPAPKTAKEKLSGPEKQEAVEALSETVNDFYQTVVGDSEGADLEAVAKESGFEVKQSEFFTKADPPKELSAFIDNLQIGKVSDGAFQLPENGDADEKLSLPFSTSDGWFLIRLDEVEDSLPLTFEEAKVKVTADLKKKMAREQMVKDANELHAKLIEAIKAGKSFADATKELEQEATEVKGLTEGQTFNFGQRSQKLPDPPEFTAAQYTNPGEIAPLEFTPSEEEADQALIVFVEKREIVKTPEYQSDLNKRYESITGNMRFVALSNWLYDRYADSEVVPPKREEQP